MVHERDPGPTPRRPREAYISARITKAERASLEGLAEEHGVSLSDALRWLVLRGLRDRMADE